MTLRIGRSEFDILGQLQQAPTATAEQLARKTKRKVTSVQYILKKLKDEGGMTIRPGINAYALGIQNVAVFFMPVFRNENSRARLMSAIVAHPKIPWCSEFVGSSQYGLNIHCRHISEVSEVLSELCEKGQAALAEKHISPRIAYSYFGRGYLSSTPQGRRIIENRYTGREEQIDELDRNILRVLAHEIFSSMREVARIVGAPSSTVDQRVRRLEKVGILAGSILQISPSLLSRKVHRIMFETQMFTDHDNKSFKEVCIRLPQTVYLNETLGSYDRELVVEVQEAAEVAPLVGEFYRIFGPKIRSVKTLAEARNLKWRLF